MQQRVFFVDMVKAMAVFFVVLIHVSSPYLLLWQQIPYSWWWLTLCLHTLAKVAVPFFIMTSGYLLLPKSYPILTFYGKKFVRLIPPWFFWGSVLFILSGVSLQSIKLIFFNGFWFMPVITGIYFFAPFFHTQLKKISPRQFSLVLILWFLIMVGTLAAKQARYITHQHSFKFFIFAFSGYFLTGGFLAATSFLKLKKYLLVISATFILSYTATVLITFFQSSTIGNYSGLWTLDVSPNMILLSVSAFVLIRLVSNRVQQKIPKLIKSVIISLSQATLGIFLSHIVLLDLLRKLVLVLDLPTKTIHPLLYIPVMTIVILFLSWRLVLMLRKIPILKWGSGVV